MSLINTKIQIRAAGHSHGSEQEYLFEQFDVMLPRLAADVDAGSELRKANQPAGVSGQQWHEF